MTVTIDLTPEEEASLRHLADNKGLPAEELVRQTVKQMLPSAETAAPVVDSKTQNLIDLLESWRREDATDDPEELDRREREWEELKANLNANRAATGERLLFS